MPKGIYAMEKRWSFFTKGRVVSQEIKDKIRKANTGYVFPEAQRKKLSDSLKLAYKEGRKKPVGYIDGRSKLRKSERQLEMQTLEYKNWRRLVFTRDNYTCVWCGIRGGTLHADHIKPRASYPELRFDLTNSRTLCVECHHKTPTWGKARSNDRMDFKTGKANIHKSL